MTRITRTFISFAGAVLSSGLILAGCAHGRAQEASGAPPPIIVEHEEAGGLDKVDHPEQFPLVTAEQYEARPALSVTGVVTNDVSRAVPVVSMASGRAVDVHARLGDEVRQGQLLMRIKSADISQAFSDYRHAVADQALARAQLDRAKALYERGAIAQKDLEVAQDTEDKAVVDVDTSAEHLRLGSSIDRHPHQPDRRHRSVSGVITERASAAGGSSRRQLRIVHDLNLSHVGRLRRLRTTCRTCTRRQRRIRLNAYPDRKMSGRQQHPGCSRRPCTRRSALKWPILG